MFRGLGRGGGSTGATAAAAACGLVGSRVQTRETEQVCASTEEERLGESARIVHSALVYKCITLFCAGMAEGPARGARPPGPRICHGARGGEVPALRATRVGKTALAHGAHALPSPMRACLLGMPISSLL